MGIQPGGWDEAAVSLKQVVCDGGGKIARQDRRVVDAGALFVRIRHDRA